MPWWDSVTPGEFRSVVLLQSDPGGQDSLDGSPVSSHNARRERARVLIGYGRMEVQIARGRNPAFKGPRWDAVCPSSHSRLFMAVRMHVENVNVRDCLLFRDLPAPRHSRPFIYESEITDLAVGFKDIPALVAEAVRSDGGPSGITNFN